MAHAYDPSTLGGWGVWITRSRVQDQPGQHDKTPSLLKIQKLVRQGGIPVIPATWEAEAGELLELGRQRLQLAEILPLHSSLSNRARLHLRGKNKTILMRSQKEERRATEKASTVLENRCTTTYRMFLELRTLQVFLVRSQMERRKLYSTQRERWLILVIK